MASFRVRRWEGDSLLHLPYIPRFKEMAQSLGVTCQASLNLSVHLPGVPLRQDFVTLCSFSLLPFAAEGGRKMVDAVLKDLPKAWNGVVVMDWSDGFWDKMKIKHNNFAII